ncbi:3-mercaptopyruvate sulfurtransferase [uncultured Cohaesibacter sp.]|uniref:3-mercaptopyruvate sulfurtransferase n=1 Tax=uncultured Cohaesibacter sp. TaxID=1002546 RepID=UPI0029C69A2F|nr:3-mercaptopyruvate sulfurtransferase [uncultured Cohaesibacter sp.]
MAERTKWLVDTDWLEEHLDSPDVVVLDGSWYLPQLERDPKEEFARAHIPGAMFFDIDEVADLSTDLPHMLPSAAMFSDAVSKMGISNGQTIVVYDGLGLSSAPRLWWTFRVMGVKDVFILDGGLPKWRAEKKPVTDVLAKRAQGYFHAQLDHSAVKSFEDMLKAIHDDSVEIVDARSEERWRGTAPEPRPHLSSGRMPGSRNVPFGGLIDETGRLKDVDALRARFVDAGVDLSKPIITSCGSGATAAILYLALDTIGQTKLALYDGSWTEWASRQDSVIERD